MDTLANEAGGGRRADLAGALRGDFTRLAAFERDLADLAAYEMATSEMRTRLSAAQMALGQVQADTADFAGTMMAATNGTGLAADVIADDARGRFASAVAALNSDVAGLSLFSGTMTEGPALAAAADMLAALEGIASAEPDGASAETAIRAWFAPGGGFDTAGYLGDATPVPDRPVGPGTTIGLGVTAADMALREVLAGLAVGALSGAGPMAGDAEAQRERLANAGVSLAGAQTGLSDLRGRVGAAEARLEEATSRNAAEAAALEIARAGLTDVDIYETATKLEAVQSQLELLYAITARSARLSLVSVL
jgi:flagellar hook-associated protein 3 FlgL